MDWGAQTVSLFLCLAILLTTIQHGNAERKVVCYYTNWSIYRPGTAKFSPQNINPYLCTHLIYAFGGFTKDNALKPFDKYQDIEKGGYAKFTGLKTYNKNLKTLLAVGGWNEGSSRFSPMVADRERRREFVKNSIKFLRKNHFDGLDLDWEYPAFRDGGKPRDKDNYANLVQELREEFDRESSKTGRPRLLLSLAMPAGIEYIDKGYDVPRLNEYLDFINLLSYDYHSSYEPAVNHHAPLYPLEEDNEYNYDSELTIDYTIEYLLKKGASPEKIILGIPTYGRSYTLFNEDATDLGSPADGPGVEGDATREKGYLAYYEICESLAASDDWEVIQPNSNAMGPYAFKGDQWVGYDDENIVRLKAKYANEKNLGGIMFWTIDNDDFRGKCHDRPYPLIEAAKEVLLTDSTNTVQQSSNFDNRKKTRLSGVQSNTVGRKSSSRRTSTTAAPITRKRVTSPRPKFRTFAQPKASVEEEDDQEVDRRSYNHSSSEEEADSDGGNAVRSADKNNRSREKSRPKNRSSSNRNRRKQSRRKGETKDDSEQGSLSNKLTTPEPPTTPDPGTDFKCEDEGFFSHPRDCKKYFWCLDAGPGGLGVVAHQFTCPSGLVFNKAADSCDYPRNVICPKSKTSQSTASTTRAPIVAATSRTTYLYSSTRKPTTEKPDSEEEYEEYDDDVDGIEEEEEEEEVKEEVKVPTTSKPLLYKTITRNKPTTTTTTTTEAPSSLSKSEKHDLEKVIGSEGEEEDPKVIKELIMLIKKAGGIEELEKQLFLQNKSPDETNSENEPATPATISRTLYERVLSRQAGKSAGRQRTSGSKSYANGPGGTQFEGLDEVPEVKTLRRSYKHQYVTIERPKSSTNEPPVEEEELNDEEDLDDDTADVASSEEQSIRNPFLTSSTQRATPNYINIRRGRPSTTAKSRYENDVDEKDEDIEEEVTPVRSRRPSISSKNTKSTSSEDTKDQESVSPLNDENSSTTKSRYISIQRFRSTTPRSPDVVSEVISTSQEPITETSVSSETLKAEEKTEAVVTTTLSTTSSTTTPSSVVLSTTPNDIDRDIDKEEPISYASSTTESVKLVEDSATEILLTTAPASLSKVSSPSTRISTATVSQPRPFGFNRRTRPADAVTTPLPASNDQTRSKVANSEPNRLPTLRELIGYQTNDHTSSPSPVHLSLLDKRTNLVLEDDDSPSNSFPDKAKVSAPRNFENVREPWTLDKNSQSNERSVVADGRENELDVFDDKAHDYVEDNDADDENASSSNKKRMDREDSSTTTLRPTTIRGPPLTTLLPTKTPRGFYVTRNETERFVTEKTDGLSTESSTLPAASTTLPTESSSLPTTSTTLPTESSSLPTTSTTLATESSSLPTTSTTLPTESSSLPTTSTTLATESSSLPTTSTILATESSSLPTTSILPTESSRLSTASTTLPTESSSLSTASTTLPTESSSLSTASTTLPTESSSLSTASTTLPTESSSLSTASTTLPTESSSLSTASTTLPTESSSLSTASTTLPTESSSLSTASTTLPTESSRLSTASTTLPTESSSLSTASTTLPTESSSLPTASSTLPTEVESHDNNIERQTIFNTNITTDTVLEQTKTKESTRTSTTIVTSTFRSVTEDLSTSAGTNGRDNKEKDPKPITQQVRQRGIPKYTDSTTAFSITDRQVTRVIRNKIGVRKRIRTTAPPTIPEQTETDLSRTDATSSTIQTPTEFSLTTLLQSNDYTTGEPSINDSPSMTTTDSSELLIDVTNSNATKLTSVLSPTTSGYSISSNAVSEKVSTVTLHEATTTHIAINDTLESVTEKLNTRNPGPNSAATQEIATATQSVQNGGNSTNDQELITSTTIATPSSTSVDKSTTTPVRRTNRGRQKIKLDSMNEFGRRGNRHRGRPSVDTKENASKKVTRPQQPRRRVTIYRGRQRRPVNGSATVPRAPNNSHNHEKPKVVEAIQTRANNSVENPNDEGEVNNGKKLVPYAIETNVHGEELPVEKAIDRAKPEVNSSKSTVMSPRIPGSLPSTRLRKPTPVSLTSSQNKSSNALANNRKNRPTDGNEKLDAGMNTTELPISEKDIDQSSRAQEIAVTLADPPTSQSPSTGRPSLRNALRRRISTTLAPRTDATTSRTTIGFAVIRGDRHKPKTKDTPQQNVTTRPRRPQVIDYDYYEDEEEPVIAKSTYNGKLFLTNKGNIRCLDQGNFPHPYSCKKFITCAKMVNGLVVGAEYTCPDKLSYDPVGGICNWSAGLGCKE